MTRARIVVGLGFGDEGKGLTTDYLCLRQPDSLVVRFSGGQQCGHNVRIGAQNHVHASFGSGTLRGLPSYFTAECSFYPVTLVHEYALLRDKGVDPVLYLHPRTRLTTPFDVLANRVAERHQRHGSCGLGIGKTRQREADGYHLHALDTTYPAWLGQKLNLIRDYYLARYHFTGEDLDWLADELTRFAQAIQARPWRLAGYELLREFPHLIFEGSQGILLDQDHGLFPHVTYAHTTSRNAVALCRELGISDWELYYVTRCYGTRHGQGWMPDESPLKLVNTADEINHENAYQGVFRIGELDYDALNHALAVDALYAGACRKHLMVTCLDQRPGFRVDYERLATRFDTIYESRSPFAERVRRRTAACAAPA